jgi:hypothetical protein
MVRTIAGAPTVHTFMRRFQKRVALSEGYLTWRSVGDAKAAIALCQKMNWEGHPVGGALTESYVLLSGHTEPIIEVLEKRGVARNTSPHPSGHRMF